MCTNKINNMFDIAFDYLKIPKKYIDIEFESMDEKVHAYFNMINQNYYYFRINDKWNKEEYTECEFNHLLSIVVHECRHYYQLCVTNDSKYMMEFVQRGYSTLEIDNWLSFEMEQDAEATRFIFLADVIHRGKKDPKDILMMHNYSFGDEIKKYIDTNIDSFDKDRAIELLNKFND